MDRNDFKSVQMAREIASVLNRYSAENASNTPDFVLAEYLVDCLAAFNAASRRREEYYGLQLEPCGRGAQPFTRSST